MMPLRNRRGLWFLAGGVCVLASLHPARAQGGGPASLMDRPLTLPLVAASEPCPVTTGSLERVPPAPHIFGSGGVWFGHGPVYLSFAWKPDKLPGARFSLQPIQVEAGTHRAKTPVVAEPSFAGPILMRGRSLAPGGGRLLFGGFGNTPEAAVRLDAPHDRPSAADWSFWATSVAIPGPGCYGIQIDTTEGTDLVIVETTA